MTLQEQLSAGNDFFAKVDDLLSERNYNEIYRLIQTTPPPSEWIVELPSKITKGETYKTIPLDIMEAAMKRIFKRTSISSISSPIITQDKSGRFAVTVSASYAYGGFEDEIFFATSLHGIATVFASDIQLLEVATPKASSMAVKNAIKQMGDFFGKGLNKEIAELELPVTKVEEEATPEELSKQLVACTTSEELRSYRLVVYAKGTPTELKELYENRLRSLTKK